MKTPESRHALSYTSEENRIIRQMWPVTIDLREILDHLPGRTAEAVRSQASKLGIVRDRRSLMMAKATAVPGGAAVEFDTARDARHVAACLSQGGFPHVRMIDDRTVWVWPVGRMAA